MQFVKRSLLLSGLDVEGLPAKPQRATTRRVCDTAHLGAGIGDGGGRPSFSQRLTSRAKRFSSLDSARAASRSASRAAFFAAIAASRSHLASTCSCRRYHW